MNILHLTKNEIEIMEILWKEQRSLTGSEIVELSQNSSWKKSSIHILLNSLIDKEAIKAEGFVKHSKAYARTFVPTITFEEYSVSQIQSNKSFTVQSIPKIVSALIDNQGTTESNENLRNELLEIIQEKTKEK